MRLRYKYLMVGIAWSLLLGPAAFLALVGFAAGASWLWLFGDNPWPAATQWVLPLIGVIGGVAVAVTCTLLAYGYGRNRETLTLASPAKEHWKVLALFITPLLLIVLLGVKVWTEGRDYKNAMTAATEREAAFVARAAAGHRIGGISVNRSSGGALHAAVQLAGEREGDYRLSWSVVDTGFGITLANGDRLVRLQPGIREIGIAFTLDELAHSYKAKVLEGRGGVLVEEPFELRVAVEPLFSDAERAALPPGEQRRLDTGESALRSQASARFSVRFVIRRDGTVEQ